jgi:hypothetical protein
MNRYTELRMAFRMCAAFLILSLFTFGIISSAAKASNAQLDIVTGGQSRAVVFIPEPDSFSGPITVWSPVSVSGGKISLIV